MNAAQLFTHIPEREPSSVRSGNGVRKSPYRTFKLRAVSWALLAIRSLPGFGTRIGVRVPFTPQAADAAVEPRRSEHVSAESA